MHAQVAFYGQNILLTFDAPVLSQRLQQSIY